MSKRIRRSLKALCRLSAFTLAGMYGVNRYVNAQALKKHSLKTQGGHYFEWKYGNIYYQISGNGERKLLLIHDSKAYASGYEWHALLDRLSDEFTVYTIDLLGCGRSDKPAITYTNYLYVTLIHDFITEIVQDSVEIAASGLSSSFVLMSALKDPDLITDITMIDPWKPKQLAKTPNIKSKIMGYIMAAPILGTFVYNLLNSRSNLEYLLDEKYFYNPFKVRTKFLNACYESAHLSSHGSGRYLLACIDGKYINWNIDRAVTLLKQPITVIYGEKSENSASSAKAYQRLNKSVVTAAIPYSKSFPHLEEPEKTADILIQQS